MKTFDRYYAKAAIGSTLMAVAVLLSLFVVIDMLASTEQFEGRSLHETLLLYLHKIPPVLYLIMPLVALLGGMAALTRILRNRELMPLQGAGVRTWRALGAFWIVAAFVALFAFALKNFVLPAISSGSSDLAAQFGRKAEGNELMLRDGAGNLWLIGKYRLAQPTPWVENATIVFYGADRRLAQTVIAPRLEYHGGQWRGPHTTLDVATLGDESFIGKPSPGGFPQKSGHVVNYATAAALAGVDLSPATIGRRGARGGERTIPQLLDALHDDPNPEGLRFELYQRFSFPSLCVSLLIIGAVMALRRQRGNLFVALVLSAGVALLLYAAYFVLGAMVMRGALSPEFASFGPAIALLVWGLVEMRWRAD